MSVQNVDDQAGSAGTDDLKSPAALGLVDSVTNPEGVLRKKNELEIELKKAKSKLNAYEQAEAQKREQDAKDKGEYQKLLEAKEKETLTLRQQVKESRIMVEAVNRYGLNVPDYVKVIVDQVSDDLGNLDEVLAGIKAKYPPMFGQTVTPFTPPADTDKAKASGNKPPRIWTDPEIKALSKEDFAKYQKEIIQQQVQGLVKSN